MRKDNLKKNTLIVGAGYMAQEYIKTFNRLKINYDLIGNKEKKVKILSKKYGKLFHFGGIKNYNVKKTYSHCVICVNEDKIFYSLIDVLNKGIKNILIEKPGGNNFNEIKKIKNAAKKYKSNVYIAYNRRFYENIFFIKKIIKKDGGVISADFSFTEWTDKIKKLKYKNDIFRKWFYFNSLHIIDLIFHLIGKPKKMSSYSGNVLFPFKNSTFVGSGFTEKKIYFSYHSNWNSAGRWGINLYTKNKKIILSPIEKIFVQKKNSLDVTEMKFKKIFDNKLKPGLAKMILEFTLNKKKKTIETYNDYCKCLPIYEKIAKSVFK